MSPDAITEFPILHESVRETARVAGGRVAIKAVDGKVLTYAGLVNCLDTMQSQLNASGIGRNDCVALVLPNGPEMAMAFVAISSCATCAPLNPAYRASECEFFLSDLAPKALVVMKGIDCPARSVAEVKRIPVFELESVSASGGIGICLRGATGGAASSRGGWAARGDTALVLHTSGTTARPKLVPLTNTNISESARNIQKVVGLTSLDTCLNAMPLFHIHGIVGALVTSLGAGATIVCPPTFEANSFLEWTELHQPTWYTAVPTIHQAICDAAGGAIPSSKRTSLRFIRSSSASLPPKLMSEIERVFGVPVIEAYGMTEATHQIASNPLPPSERKPGSVGLPAGPEVAILDPSGIPMVQGMTGEVAIRGSNVMAGYQSNDVANQSAFVNGFFRTGDTGSLDQHGYLFLTGRLKEIINRAGEKISPREVDEVLLDHPAVAKAVAFAVPHSALGEDIAAAVVLKTGASATETGLRDFVAGRLAAYKVPQQILIVGDIPKGPTGKVQRIGLAETFADRLRADFVAPTSIVEKQLVEIWREVLRVEKVGVRENFFALGGDSLKATAVIGRARKIGLAVDLIFQRPTIAELAEVATGTEVLSEGGPPVVADPAGEVSKRSLQRLAFAALLVGTVLIALIYAFGNGG